MPVIEQPNPVQEVVYTPERKPVLVSCPYCEGNRSDRCTLCHGSGLVHKGLADQIARMSAD